jgi:PAS domain S-box-containing protein
MLPAPLLNLFSLPANPALVWHVGHHHGMVLLSLLVAMVSAVLAIQTASQLEATRSAGLWRAVWLAGSLTLGLGIWAMHFIGMMALEWPTPVHYDLGLTLLSMVPSTAAAAVALDLLAHRSATTSTLLWRGLVMGGGIGVMHYTGMAALDSGLAQRYSATLFLLSVLVAVGGAVGSLWLHFWLRAHAAWLKAVWRHTLAGVVMGLAVASMHYVGMATVTFVGPLDPLPNGYWDRLPMTGLIVFVLALLAALLLGLNALVRMGQMAQALRRSEEQVRALMDNLPGITLQLERAPPWRIQLASQRTLALLGHDPASAVGLALESSVFQPGLPEQREALQQVLHGLSDGAGPAQLQADHKHLHLCLTHRNGAARWFSASLRAGGAAPHTAASQIDVMLEDVTEQLAAQAELERAHYIIEASEDAIVSQDLAGTIVTWNRGAEKLYGYTAAEAVGQPIQMLHVDAEHERNQKEQALIQSGATLRSHEAVRRHKNGDLLHVLVSSSPIRDAAGRLQGAFKIVHDISDRKNNEALRLAKERAEQMAAVRANFLANMSHELRTPMTAVLGFTSVLLETPLNEEQTRHLRTVHNSARALLRLLNDILDTAKLERGALELECLPFDLDELLSELDQTLGRHARSKGLQFSVQRHPAVPRHFMGDALRLRQVLSNLLDNAIKFTESGSVTLQVNAGPSGKGLALAVSDTGIGMSPQTLAHIFEPFTQADATMSRRYGGTGLGTTICKQLVDLMQGTIAVNSQLGAGSTFRVEVPLEPAPHNAAESAPTPAQGRLAAPAGTAPPPPKLPRLKLLLVDDVSLNLELLHLLLHQDHDTVACGSGAQAVELAGHSHFDLILMDIQMPEVNGLEATRRIRANEAARHAAPVPIIALTASVLEQDRKAAFEAGMNGFAVKPLELPSLLAEMARVLGLNGTERDETMNQDAMALLDEAAGVATWGGMRDMWLEGLGMLHKQITADTALIHQSLGQSMEASIGPVHALRGASASLSAVALFELLDQLETALRQRDAQAVQACADRLDTTAQATQKAIAALLQGDPQAPAGNTSLPGTHKAAAREAIAVLTSALARGEIPVGGLAPLEQALGRVRPEPVWPALVQALDLYEFDEALQLLAELGQWLDAQPG